MIRHILSQAAPEREVLPAGPMKSTRDAYVIDIRLLAALVGLIALLLPTLLIAYARTSETCARDSISHYYYSPFVGSVFVACLTLIGVFLIAYRGDSFRWETYAAKFAGVMAFLVALFPTEGHGCAGAGPFDGRPFVAFAAQTDDNFTIPLDPVNDESVVAVFQLFEHAQKIHFGAAILLFVFLLVYAFYVFPAVSPRSEGRTAPMGWYKTFRNVTYYATALAIAVAMGRIGLHFSGLWPDPTWEAENKLFFWEAIALYAFGLGWILKGRVFGLLPEE